MHNEEASKKIIGVILDGTSKITEEVLAKALSIFNSKNEMQSNFKGRQSIDKLMTDRSKLSNINIDSTSIKTFNKYAKKFDIDYSLVKDKSSEPQKYIVFFKGKDIDVLSKAFKAFSQDILEKKQTNKFSIISKIKKMKQLSKEQNIDKEKSKVSDLSR